MSVADVKIEVSIFDLDRTLTRRPTYSAFLLFAAIRLAPWRLLLIPTVIPFAIAWRMGWITRRRLKDAMHAALIGRSRPKRRVAAVAQQFAERVLARNLYPQVPERLAAERAAGRDLVIATAAPRVYAEPIAQGLGVDSVVATEFARPQRRRIYGTNCYGAEKRRRIRDALANAGIGRHAAHIRFFSDDLADLPTFEWVDEPIAVNPSRKLAAHAVRKGWPILDWRRAAA